MYLKPSNHFHLLPEATEDNPFDDSFPDSLRKLKETTDLVKLFPMGSKDGVGSTKSSVIEAPPTPGRPVFSFSVGSKKNHPSKWDNAEKWIVTGPDSPAHHLHGNNGSVVKQQEQMNRYKTEVSCGVTEEKVSKAVSVNLVHQDHHQFNNLHKPFNGVSISDPSDVLLKDKFTNGEEPCYSRFKCVVPIKEGSLLGSMKDASTEVIQELKDRETTAPRCPTPYKSVSPPRHTTPASMSGPLALMNASSSFDIAELQECHLAKLQQETPFESGGYNWSSREEEEDDVSKSLRHFEMKNESPKSVQLGPAACAWEEEERTKSDLRYQREEAKIQAWVNLQNAKAEAESRKLEVKIQKMRSKFEEKMMKRMANVHRKAQELRAAAEYEHKHKMKLGKSTVQSKGKCESSCGCFPCSPLYP